MDKRSFTDSGKQKSRTLRLLCCFLLFFSAFTIFDAPALGEITFDLTVHHVDTVTGAEITEPDIQTVLFDRPYSVSPKALERYYPDYSRYPDNAAGTAYKRDSITFYYQPSYTVTAEYVSPDGTLLASEVSGVPETPVTDGSNLTIIGDSMIDRLGPDPLSENDAATSEILRVLPGAEIYAVPGKKLLWGANSALLGKMDVREYTVFAFGSNDLTKNNDVITGGSLTAKDVFRAVLTLYRRGARHIYFVTNYVNGVVIESNNRLFRIAARLLPGVEVIDWAGIVTADERSVRIYTDLKDKNHPMGGKAEQPLKAGVGLVAGVIKDAVTYTQVKDALLFNGDEYMTEALSFAGYRLDRIEGCESGAIDKSDVTVRYYYALLEPAPCGGRLRTMK